MRHPTRTLATVLVLGLAGVVRLGAQPAPVPESVRQASLADGVIQGTVSDAAGRGLAGALVTALGAASAVVTTDLDGTFTMRGLPPGHYLLRAHLAGFFASEREMIELRPNARLVRLIQLRAAAAEAMSVPAVMTAGFPGDLFQPAPGSGDDAAGGDHPHTPMAWQLRHIKRSVLRDVNGLPLDFGAADDTLQPGDASPGTWLGWAFASSARMASALFSEFPFSGEINLLTTSTFDDPQDLFSGDRLPRGVAFLSLGAPAGEGDWSMKAALTGGDVSSWILAGSYAVHGPRAHAYDVGLSYGTQAYKGGNTAALAALADSTRNVGAVYAFDDWKISRRVELDYGARWARYGYVDRPNMLSPRAALRVSPFARTFLRASVSQRMLAPGAEEFLPPTSGVWLPPERTFTGIGSGGFRAERVRSFGLALERQLDDSFVLSVRRFYQRSDDQMVTLFGFGPALGVGADRGHYYVGSTGGVDADGWGVSLSSSSSSRLKGSIDYSRTRARWTTSTDAGLLETLVPSAVRLDSEDFQDLTTSVEAAIPETATRVYVVYKLNTAFARADATTPGFDGRFDVQVNQTLPFRLVSAEWEVLVGVRNLFREAGDQGSVYDELLVVRPPKRIIGGVLVRF